MLGLVGVGDDRVPSRVNLEADLDLTAGLDRVELGAVGSWGQVIVLGPTASLPVTVQVGVAVVSVVRLDLFDRTSSRGSATPTDPGAGGRPVGGRRRPTPAAVESERGAGPVVAPV